MTGLPIVTRRDMLGEPCLFCEGGKYRLEWGLLGDGLSCHRCGAAIERWLTKREVLEVITQQHEELV